MRGFEERRFDSDAARFRSQYVLTLLILAVFAGVNWAVFMTGDKGMMTAMVQSDIALTLLAAGFWFGSSKGSADKDHLAERNLQVPPPEQGGKTTTVTTETPPMERTT